MFDPGSAPPKHDPPAGMEPYDLARDGDLGALSNAQQAATNKLKTQTRINNEQYLRRHPEVKYMITAFLSYFLDFFTSPNLVSNIEAIKDEYMKQYHDDQVMRSLAKEEPHPFNYKTIIRIHWI
ncbi:RIIa domain-containing protein 1 [Schistosoma japonicum]|nr:RIIa domain-containing protein 1 [Schistosoma japonicum]